MQQQLADIATRQQVLLERLKAGEVKKIVPFLKRIDAGLRDQLTAADITSYSKTRVERLIKGVDSMLSSVLDDYKSEVMATLDDVAVHASTQEAKTLDDIMPNGFETVIPTAEQVIAAIRTSPLSVRGPDGGKLLDPFIADWTKAERSAITGAIRQGFFEGQTTDQIVRKIRGTAGNQFKDGLLQISKNHAQAVVQTAIQHAASTARMETLKANTDIANQYQWVSTLDGRTTQQCRSLDGQKFSYGHGPVPPIHIRCRSTIVPALNDEFAWLSQGATRASKDGYVPQDETYYDWLKRQPHEFQDTAIGKTRAKLFRDGGLSADEFARLNLGKNFAPLTLDEMRQINGEAFMRAFGEASGSAINAAAAKTTEEMRAIAVDYVVGNGAKYGVEFAHAVSYKTGDIVLQKRGRRSDVSFTEREAAQIRNAEDVVMYHNHPSNSSLSVADSVFAASLGLKSIVAMATTDAGEYISSPRASAKAIKDAADTANYEIRKRIGAYYSTGRLSDDQANAVHAHLLNLVLDKLSLIAYEYPAIGGQLSGGLQAVGDSRLEKWLTEIANGISD